MHVAGLLTRLHDDDEAADDFSLLICDVVMLQV
jgi:hypothetical protein